MRTLRAARQSALFAKTVALADAFVADNRERVADALIEAARRVREAFASGDVASVDWVASVAAFEAPAMDDSVLDALVATRLLAHLTTLRETASAPKAVRAALEARADRVRIAAFAETPAQLDKATEKLLATVDPLYANAARWMRRRKVATRAEIAELVRAARIVAPSIPVDLIEAEVRAQVAAYAGAPTAEMGRIFRDLIARTVGKGETVGVFLAEIDAVVAAGKLPPQMDAYLHTVYRTETAMAYTAQRRKDWAAPAIAPYVWGRQLFNALLPSSRPSHMAINGLKLQKGSAADARAGHPPWSYNCTCTETLLMAVGGAASPAHVEPLDALGRVSAIERFA